MRLRHSHQQTPGQEAVQPVLSVRGFGWLPCSWDFFSASPAARLPGGIMRPNLTGLGIQLMIFLCRTMSRDCASIDILELSTPIESLIDRLMSCHQSTATHPQFSSLDPCHARKTGRKRLTWSRFLWEDFIVRPDFGGKGMRDALAKACLFFIFSRELKNFTHSLASACYC